MPEPLSVDDQGLVFTKLLQGLLCAGVRFEGVQRVNRYPGALFWGGWLIFKRNIIPVKVVERFSH